MVGKDAIDAVGCCIQDNANPELPNLGLHPVIGCYAAHISHQQPAVPCKSVAALSHLNIISASESLASSTVQRREGDSLAVDIAVVAQADHRTGVISQESMDALCL